MTTRLLLAAVAATAALAACGGDDAKPAAAPDAANRKAMLDFARCMREHGVKMPDPQFESGGRTTTKMDGRNLSPEKMRAAEKACAKYRDAVKPPTISDEQREEFRKQALANARCMREHGINMPDPKFNEDGGATMELRRGEVDPESAKFKAAQKACRDTMPGGGSTNMDGGGEDGGTSTDGGER